ncbi:MAG: outer membrane lipoprotein carrier protein LolA [Xanthobacteraceae bacterium]
MRSRHGLAVIGAVLGGLLATDPAALAETVPMPVPAPHTRSRATPPAPVKQNRATPTNTRTIAQAAPTPPAPPAALPQVATAGAAKGGAPPFDNAQRALVERANGYLSGLNTLVGNFVQIGPDGGRTEGKFYLQKPGRVRFEYNPPSPIEVISDGTTVAVRDRNLATQNYIPLSQTPLRFLVADRVDLFKDTNVVSVSSDDTFAIVVIEERQTLGGTHRVMVMFGVRDFQLRQWTVTDPQGYDTTVALYNLDPKQKPDPSLFKIDYTRYLQ